MSKSKQVNPLRAALHGMRGILFFSIVMSLVYGLLKLAGPLFMILVFDRVLPARSRETLVALLLLLTITIGVMTLLDYARRRIMARFGAQFQEGVEQHIFSSQARESYLAKGGKKPAAGLNETDQLRGFFHSGSLITILDFLWSPVFLGIVFVIDPLIGWVVVFGLVVLALINVARNMTQTEQMTAAYNQRWLAARRRTRDAAVELKDWTAWFSITASHVALLIQYVALAAGAYQTINGDITIGAMVASMYLARHVVNRAERFLAEIPDMLEASRNWQNLSKILAAPRRPVATPEPVSALTLSQLTVRCLLTKRTLLRNVNAAFAPGSTIEIVGGAGSGKTILAETLIGRMPRASGKVLLGCIDIERLSSYDGATTIGYIPQRIDFVDGTIEENLVGFAPVGAPERLVQIARIAGVHERIAALPDGYQTHLDPLGSVFSKGERHQLALARALYHDPQILIVDEPDTSFRDALKNDLGTTIADFTGAGGIMVVLTRVPLKIFRSTHRYNLDAGVLREIKSDSAPIHAVREPLMGAVRPNLTRS